MTVQNLKYKAIFKPNQLIHGDDETLAIVCGWTPKERVAKLLDRSRYSVIGQLYNPSRGINFLVRNLLANPQITTLVILNATKEDKNSGGCVCLSDFFHYGCEREHKKDAWQIVSTVDGTIDSEINLSAIRYLIENIRVYRFGDLKEMVVFVNNGDCKSGTKRDRILEFPFAEHPTLITPSNIIGQRIQGETIAETWLKILARIRKHGTLRPTGYDGQWQELINLVAVVTDEPKDFYFPEPNYLPVDQQAIINYLPSMCDDAPYVEGVKYSYGQRMRSWFGRDQIQEVCEKLIAEKDTASAVISLWDSGNNFTRRVNGTSDHKNSGSPCLNHVWIRVIGGKLTLTATFRSNDMFSAWVSNAMGLRCLQRLILDYVNANSDYGLGIGELVTISQSAHIYDYSFQFADETCKKYLSCKQVYKDEVGNFIVDVGSTCEITVTQTTPDGVHVRDYVGSKPLKLIREIAEANPTIEASHIGYLGLELQKAYDISNRGVYTYKQDA